MDNRRMKGKGRNKSQKQKTLTDKTRGPNAKQNKRINSVPRIVHEVSKLANISVNFTTWFVFDDAFFLSSL